MIEICSLYSGSSGNCIYVGDDSTAVLIDAGVSGKAIIDALKSKDKDFSKIKALLVTHEHTDHIKSAGVVSRKLDIPIYANEATWESMRSSVGKLPTEKIKIFEKNGYTDIGTLCLHGFSIPHDAADPMGYTVMSGDHRVTVATDIGHMDDELFDEIAGSSAVLLESNHDIETLKVGAYPYYLKQRILGAYGHLCNDVAAETVLRLIKKGTTRFVMGHLSKENNHPDLVYMTSKAILAKNGIDIKKDIYFDVARRDAPGMSVVIA